MYTPRRFQNRPKFSSSSFVEQLEQKCCVSHTYCKHKLKAFLLVVRGKTRANIRFFLTLFFSLQCYRVLLLNERKPTFLPEFPSVTPWYNVTPAPMMAVAPTTSPVPWSIRIPPPEICAAGWMSMAVAYRTTDMANRGNTSETTGIFCWRRAWLSRYQKSAQKPVQIFFVGTQG